MHRFSVTTSRNSLQYILTQQRKTTENMHTVAKRGEWIHYRIGI